MNKDALQALAASLYALHGVAEITRTGQLDAQYFSNLHTVLYRSNQATLEDYFPNATPLYVGASLACCLLSPKDSEIFERYRLEFSMLPQLLRLERYLAEEGKALSGVRYRLKQVDNTQEAIEEEIAQIARIFADWISPLPRKVVIKGERDILARPLVIEHIRALLLCALRCAGLWYANGGRQRHFLFKRRALLEILQAIKEGK